MHLAPKRAAHAMRMRLSVMCAAGRRWVPDGAARPHLLSPVRTFISAHKYSPFARARGNYFVVGLLRVLNSPSHLATSLTPLARPVLTRDLAEPWGRVRASASCPARLSVDALRCCRGGSCRLRACWTVVFAPAATSGSRFWRRAP